MAVCYLEDVRFSDPLFTDLRGTDAGDMWRMLCAKGDALRRERVIKALAKPAKEALVAAQAVIAVVDNAPSA